MIRRPNFLSHHPTQSIITTTTSSTDTNTSKSSSIHNISLPHKQSSRPTNQPLDLYPHQPTHTSQLHTLNTNTSLHHNYHHPHHKPPYNTTTTMPSIVQIACFGVGALTKAFPNDFSDIFAQDCDHSMCYRASESCSSCSKLN